MHLVIAGPPRLKSLVTDLKILAKFEAEVSNYKVRQVDCMQIVCDSAFITACILQSKDQAISHGMFLSS